MSSAPLIFEWDGEAMVPLPRFARRCDAEYVVHQHYRLAVVEDRSAKSHSHYFASLDEAWLNLPEEYGDRWPSSEHLRKWALIQAGYRDERTFVAASKAEALRLATFLRPMDEYAVIVVRESVVVVLTAQSQSLKAMGRKEFGESKRKVLDIVWNLSGLSHADAGKHVGKAA